MICLYMLHFKFDYDWQSCSCEEEINALRTPANSSKEERYGYKNQVMNNMYMF